MRFANSHVTRELADLYPGKLSDAVASRIMRLLLIRLGVLAPKCPAKMAARRRTRGRDVRLALVASRDSYSVDAEAGAPVPVVFAAPLPATRMMTQ